MAKQYPALNERLIQFISEQKIFFVGTATSDSRVSVSPKGLDTLRVLSDSQVVWLSVTGSGNETSAHVQNDPRMTIMFCAFEGPPLVLRLYGSARVIHLHDEDWQTYYAHFDPLLGTRQIFDLTIELVQTSCGMGVPNYAYTGDRDMLLNWAEKKGNEGLHQYWEEKNQFSIDGILTNIAEKND